MRSYARHGLCHAGGDDATPSTRERPRESPLAPSTLRVDGAGLVAAFGDDFVERIRRSTRDIAFDVNFKNARIMRAELGDDAGVIGAAMLARESLRC